MLQVLAMCFVRKGLDWVFTRHELTWLDDIMPETHKKEKEEKKKKLMEERDEPEKKLSVSLPMFVQWSPHCFAINIKFSCDKIYHS